MSIKSRGKHNADRIFVRLDELKNRLAAAQIEAKTVISATEDKRKDLERYFDDGKWTFVWEDSYNRRFRDFGMYRNDTNFDTIDFHIKGDKVHVAKLGGYAERHNELQDKLNEWLQSAVTIDEDYDYEQE